MSTHTTTRPAANGRLRDYFRSGAFERLDDGAKLSLKRPGLFLVLITPELAAAWLETFNVENRRLRPGHAAYLARIMANGEWRPDHPDPILFSRAGRLINGQHRLTAVVTGGKSVWMRVETGADDAIRQHIDTNAVRSLGDRARFIDNPTQNTKAASLINSWMRISTGEARRMTPDEAWTFFEKHRAAVLWMAAAVAHDRGIGRTPVSVAICEYHERDAGKAADFYESLGNREGKLQQTQILREWLIRYAPGGGNSMVREIYGRTICACKAHLAGKRVNRLTLASWDA
jgi:hypothetical protein